MPLDPVNDKFEVYDVATKRQRLIDVTEVLSGSPIIPLYEGNSTGTITITDDNAAVAVVFTPVFPARATASATEPPGLYNLIFSLTGTIEHTVTDPNDRFGGKVYAVVKVGTTEVARNHAPVVFTGEEFSLLVTKVVQLADTDVVSVELQGDVNAIITPDQCFLQAAYMNP
jgi:hypothetical protein